MANLKIHLLPDSSFDLELVQSMCEKLCASGHILKISHFVANIYYLERDDGQSVDDWAILYFVNRFTQYFAETGHYIEIR